MNFPPELLLKAQGVRFVFFDFRDMLTQAAGGSDASHDVFRPGQLDCLGLEMLQKTGITPVILCHNADAAQRASGALPHVSHDNFSKPGAAGKTGVVDNFLKNAGLDWNQAAVTGFDWPDLGLMRRAGFSAAAINAHAEVRAMADYVMPCCSGQGAVRTLCDLLLVATGRYVDLLQEYGT